jgi:hypothetical protein
MVRNREQPDMGISASMKKGRTRSTREGLLRVREPSNRIGGETSALGRVDQFAMPSAKNRNPRKRDMAQSGWCRREAAIAGRENEVAIGRTPVISMRVRERQFTAKAVARAEA